jgi:hypothetical protein
MDTFHGAWSKLMNAGRAGECAQQQLMKNRFEIRA